MKLSITLAETKDLLADKYNLVPSEIDIVLPASDPYTPFAPDVKIAEVLKQFLAIAGTSAFSNSLFSNKIALIKGVRAVTGLDLKRSKDLVEAAEAAAKANQNSV